MEKPQTVGGCHELSSRPGSPKARSSLISAECSGRMLTQDVISKPMFPFHLPQQALDVKTANNGNDLSAYFSHSQVEGTVSFATLVELG